jgi:hypothetical protein
MKENNKIFLGRIKHILICSGLVLFIVSSAIPARVAHAQRRVKGEWVLPKHYPDGFDGMGHIDRIAKDEIVIDDVLLRLSPSVTYRTPKTKHSTSAHFSPGNLVGYLKNSEGEVISLWLIK